MVSGLFAPRYFRSSERKFLWSSYWELSLPGTNVLENFRSQFTFAPAKFRLLR